ncbi:MAG: GFA family protein [Pseudomonadota bacterium]
MEREASCSCGTLRVTCYGEPLLVSLCHCIACKKRTGGPFGVGAFFNRDKVEIEGDYKTYERSSDSGYKVAFHFCSNCGSTVFWEPERKPDVIAVGIGSFGDPTFRQPDQEVYTDHRHDWVPVL